MINIPYKNCVHNCLPEDEPMMFKTCRRLKNMKEKKTELNY
jgi:hypothetical protein